MSDGRLAFIPYFDADMGTLLLAIGYWLLAIGDVSLLHIIECSDSPTRVFSIIQLSGLQPGEFYSSIGIRNLFAAPKLMKTCLVMDIFLFMNTCALLLRRTIEQLTHQLVGFHL